MGFRKGAAAAALRQTNNDMMAAIQVSSCKSFCEAV